MQQTFEVHVTEKMRLEAARQMEEMRHNQLWAYTMDDKGNIISVKRPK